MLTGAEAFLILRASGGGDLLVLSLSRAAFLRSFAPVGEAALGGGTFDPEPIETRARDSRGGAGGATT
jgi:hypothetical protein